MLIYVETSLHTKAVPIYEQTAEFSKNPPADVIDVPEGRIGIGSITNRFRSNELEPCSVLAIANPWRSCFAFWHVYAGQEPKKRDVEDLQPLIGGCACPVYGSRSIPIINALRDLFKSLDITLTDPISVETRGKNGSAGCFHAAFRPAANQILVARISYEDIQQFPAFTL